nr:UDP-glycosyltransferase 86A2-like [Tanacetum cinerariifolium]
MSNRTENPHAIFIPFPLQGHIIPSVLLATKLASNGFTVTFVNTESIHHSVTKSSSQSTHDVFADARKSGLDIRYATVSDGLPVSFDRSLNHDQYMESMSLQHLPFSPATIPGNPGRLVAGDDFPG